MTEPEARATQNSNNGFLDSKLAKSRISNEYAYNINSTNFPALTLGRKNRKTTLREIIAIGDSHLWGQGSPDGDYANGGLFTSRHIGQPYNGGFGNRLKEYINHKYDFYESMVSFDNIGSWPAITNPYYVTSQTDTDTNTTDPNKKSDKINLISGNVKIQSGVSINGATTDGNFFTPEARGISEVPSDIGYQTTARQLKFGTGIGYFSNESNGNFNVSNKESIKISPSVTYTTESETFTTYKNNGSIYYGFITADKSNQFVVIDGKIKPDWVTANSYFLIEGYGLVKISGITDIGTTSKSYLLFFTKLDNSAIGVDLSGCIYVGKDLFFYIFTNFKFLYSMKHHASKMFLNVVKNPNGCKVYLDFKSPYDGGIRSTDLEDLIVSSASSPYHVNKTGYPLVYKLSTVGTLIPSSAPEVVIASNYISIDTYSATTEDAIFVVDWGYKQKGILRFEYGDANASATIDAVANSTLFKTRGFFFDDNIVKIHGFGAHTTSMLLGNSADTDRAATNHIAELLQYSITCPYLLIVQAPIVNEYFNQTPLATFTANLTTIVNQFAAFRNGNYPGTLYTDVLFITTIGSESEEFISDAQPIKYSDYFAALKTYCDVKSYGLVDFRQWFKDSVSKGIIDYEMLYDDVNHPSPFANEFIAKELFKIIDLII